MERPEVALACRAMIARPEVLCSSRRGSQSYWPVALDVVRRQHHPSTYPEAIWGAGLRAGGAAGAVGRRGTTLYSRYANVLRFADIQRFSKPSAKPAGPTNGAIGDNATLRVGRRPEVVHPLRHPGVAHKALHFALAVDDLLDADHANQRDVLCPATRACRGSPNR